MFDTEHVYDLSFIPPSEEQKTPHIIFTTHSAHLPEIQQRLHILVDRYKGTAIQYMGPGAFLFPVEESAEKRFGYGKCGFLTHEGDLVHWHLELKSSHLRYCTLTIHLLVIALSVPMENVRGLSNRPQQINLHTRCDPRGDAHAHGMSGRISGEIMKWLKKHAKGMPKGHYYLPLPAEVTDAMTTAWRAVSIPKLKKYGSGCKGFVCDDGRFILQCFGDACDLAIYPDSYSERHDDTTYGVEFSCHNLDRADQQITLLAGLAKIYELAREQE